MTTPTAIGWAIAFTCVGLPIYFAVASRVGRMFRRQKPAQDEWWPWMDDDTDYGPRRMWGPVDAVDREWRGGAA